MCPFRAFSIDSGVVTTQEVFEHDLSSITAEKLFNELQRVKEDLKSKNGEIRRANEIRENTDREIEDLTASLFEVRK
jgi:predicted  nucleic acid-binding Zn-ribbon protein